MNVSARKRKKKIPAYCGVVLTKNDIRNDYDKFVKRMNDNNVIWIKNSTYIIQLVNTLSGMSVAFENKEGTSIGYYNYMLDKLLNKNNFN